MKKVVTMMILLAIIMTMPLQALAASTSDLTFELTADGNGYVVSECNPSASGKVTIPATYNGKPVTEIGDAAFFQCENISSVVIPDSVLTIGALAFAETNLEKVVLGKGVQSVGTDAFDVNGFIDEVEVSDLSAWCKIAWESQHSVMYSAKIMLNGKLLTKLVIPDDVTVINDYAFRGIEGLVTVTIPNQVTSIGDGAFYGCDNLVTVNMGDGVTSIGEFAFSQCDALKNLNLGKNVTHVEACAVAANNGLVSVTLPDSLTIIPDDMFFHCTNLQTVVLGKNVTTMGKNVFFGCENLKTVTIPRTLTTMGDDVFADCPNLTTINFDGTIDEWNSIRVGLATPDLKIEYTNPCASGHTFGNWEIMDQTNHKRVCSVCFTEDVVGHDFDNGCDTTCNTCTMTRETNHEYQTALSYDANGHWHECSICHDKQEQAAHTPGAAATETAPQTCTECGYIIEYAQSESGSANGGSGSSSGLVIAIIVVVVIAGGGFVVFVLMKKIKKPVEQEEAANESSDDSENKQ